MRRRGEKLWTRSAEFIVAGVGAYFAARTLARLSGTALWVPKEWREAIDVLTGALGGTVFVTVRLLTEVWNPPVPAAEVSGKRRLEAETRRKKKTLGILLASVFFIILALGALGAFMRLRTACVVPFDPRDWLAQQKLHNALDASADAKRLAVAGATSEPAGEPYPDNTLHVPEFVDLERQKVYLPMRYPDALDTYLKNLGKANDADGLTFMLAHEPDHLFDIIEKQASPQVTETNWKFLKLDATIIVLFAIGLAGSFDIPSAVGDWLGR